MHDYLTKIFNQDLVHEGGCEFIRKQADIQGWD